MDDVEEWDEMIAYLVKDPITPEDLVWAMNDGDYLDEQNMANVLVVTLMMN